MAKYPVVIVFAVVVYVCQAMPGSLSKENDIATAAANGQWDVVQKMLEGFYKSRFNLTPLAQTDLRTYKVSNSGEKFYGESDSQFHYSSNVNGKINENSGGHRIVNDNGRVSEYDYKPPRPDYHNIKHF